MVCWFGGLFGVVVGLVACWFVFCIVVVVAVSLALLLLQAECWLPFFWFWLRFGLLFGCACCGKQRRARLHDKSKVLSGTIGNTKW